MPLLFSYVEVSMRYGGYSDPLEALVDLLNEQKKTNELLEQLLKGGTPCQQANDHPAITETKAAGRSRGTARTTPPKR